MIQTKITSERKQFIKKTVADAYEHWKHPKLPVAIKELTRSYSNIRLISYSKHMKRMGLSYSYMINVAKDSFTDYYADSNMYYIYYNDLDNSINSSNRYRWNIAHELGHVLLKHLSENSKTRLLRSSLSDKEYYILEEEAEYFAQLILVPHAALLGFQVNSYNNIKVMCKISDQASKRRYREFIRWKSHINAQDEYDNRIFHYYFKFIFKRTCKNCGLGIVQRYGKYCPICGCKNTLQWGDGDKMKYPLLDTYETGKLKECPNCHNEETNIDGYYCQICGMSLVNNCSNITCKNHKNALSSNARYCPICGFKSTFYNLCILKAWDYNESFLELDIITSIPDEIDEELPFN